MAWARAGSGRAAGRASGGAEAAGLAGAAGVGGGVATGGFAGCGSSVFGSWTGGLLATAGLAGTRSPAASPPVALPDVLFTRGSGRAGRRGPSSTRSSTVRASRLP